MKYFRYSSYVIRHKWFVFVECYKLGIPWLGIVYDISKFLPSEFIPYVNYFYGKKDEDIKKGRDSTGYYKPYDTGNVSFDFAWLLHQKRNKHHWQWWILPMDEEGIKIMDIPMKYRKEMLADWRGAGKAQGTPNTKKWWETNKHKIQIREDVRQWVEENV